MKAIINGKFLTQKITGVQRYAREILLELDKIVNKNEIEIAVPNDDLIDTPSYKNISIVKVGKLKGNLWEQISFPLYVAKQNGVSINLCNTSPLLKPGIVCIHDVKINATPQYFNKNFVLWYRLLFYNTAKRAKKIITVSEFSKSEIIKYYGVDKEKIVVIPNAWQHFERIEYDENTLNKYNLESKRYYFAMSSLEPNKNFKWIAEAAKSNPDEVFAVSGSINNKVFSDNFDMDNIDNLKFLGYVSDGEAKTLMRECKAFLFPSFYEGFGIPPMEAIASGASQIMVSDTPCMHEIYEEYVVYIEPYNYNTDIKSKSLNDTHNIQNFLIKYSWKTSAKKLLEIIEKGIAF